MGRHVRRQPAVKSPSLHDVLDRPRGEPSALRIGEQRVAFGCHRPFVLQVVEKGSLGRFAVKGHPFFVSFAANGEHSAGLQVTAVHGHDFARSKAGRIHQLQDRLVSAGCPPGGGLVQKLDHLVLAERLRQLFTPDRRLKMLSRIEGQGLALAKKLDETPERAELAGPSDRGGPISPQVGPQSLGGEAKLPVSHLAELREVGPIRPNRMRGAPRRQMIQKSLNPDIKLSGGLLQSCLPWSLVLEAPGPSVLDAR